MKKEPFRKQPYVSPAIEVIPIALEHQLLETSFKNNGGHGKAGDDDDEINDAKQGFFDEEEEEDTPKWGI